MRTLEQLDSLSALSRKWSSGTKRQKNYQWSSIIITTKIVGSAVILPYFCLPIFHSHFTTVSCVPAFHPSSLSLSLSKVFLMSLFSSDFLSKKRKKKIRWAGEKRNKKTNEKQKREKNIYKNTSQFDSGGSGCGGGKNAAC